MIQTCTHFSGLDENFIPKDADISAPQNEKFGFDHSCCEGHLWTFIKENHLDQIHAFIWKINDTVFNPLQINFDLDHADEPTKKGVMLKSTYAPFTGLLRPYIDIFTPFGKIHFPLAEVPNHKSTRQFFKFIGEHRGELHQEKKFSRYFFMKYSDHIPQAELYPAEQKRPIEILNKIWDMLEKERLKIRDLQPSSENMVAVSPNMVSTFELLEEIPDKTYPYFKTVKFNKDGEIKCLSNGNKRQYFLSPKEFGNLEELKVNTPYDLTQVEMYKTEFNHCKIKLIDGREVDADLDQIKIGVLIKEICPKVLIASGLKNVTGKVIEGKSVNAKAETILTALFENVNNSNAALG